MANKDCCNDLGKAVPLISIVNKRFHVHEESIEILSNPEYKTVGMISLVGKYRTGKSFLLNRVLLNQTSSEGFGVGATIRPCTKGIWMWSKPLVIENKYHDEKFHVFFIDTEGLGAYDEEINHDTKIFLMAILMSSLFLFNSFSSIDESAINSLSFILNLSQAIKINKNDDKAKPEELAKYFPSFLWLIRDFSLKLEDSEGNTITSKQYLENALALVKGSSSSVEEKNRIRRMINLYFAERDCFTMIRPVESEEDLQNLKNLPDDLFRPEFMKQAETLRNKVFKKVKPKIFNGKVLSGEMILDLITSIVQSINDGGLPIIENSWNYVVANENVKHAEVALKKYNEEINKFKIRNGENTNFQNDLQAFNKDLIKKLLEEFRFNFVDSTREEYEEKLKTKLNEEFKRFNETNMKFFEKRLRDLLEQQEFEISEYFNKEKYINNHYEFFKDVEDQIEKAEISIPEFPMKVDLIYHNKFSLIKRFIEEVHIKEKNLVNKEVFKLRNEMLNHEAKAKILQAEIEELNENHRKSNKESTEEIVQLKTENRAYDEKIKYLEKTQRQLIEENYSSTDKFKQDYDNKVFELNKRIISLNDELKARDNQILTMKLNDDKMKALHSQKTEFLNKEVESLKQRNKNLILELNENKTTIESLSQNADKKQNENNSLDGNSKLFLYDEEDASLMKQQVESLRFQLDETKKVYEDIINNLKNTISKETTNHNKEANNQDTKEIMLSNKVIDNKIESL